MDKENKTHNPPFRDYHCQHFGISLFSFSSCLHLTNIYCAFYKCRAQVIVAEYYGIYGQISLSENIDKWDRSYGKSPQGTVNICSKETNNLVGWVPANILAIYRMKQGCSVMPVQLKAYVLTCSFFFPSCLIF